MNNGKYKYYTIQLRKKAENTWCEEESPIIEIPESQREDWGTFSWDTFGHTAEPWHGQGNDYRPKYNKSHDETHEVWCAVGYRGWWSLKYAEKALKRLETANVLGKFDTLDGYRNLCRKVRYEFRIVKIKVSKKTKVIT